MKRAIFIFVLFILSCSQPPETRYFTLGHQAVGPGIESSDEILIINKFESTPLYFQDKFIYRPSQFEVKYDHYKRWIQPPPELLQLRTVDYIKSTNGFGSVSTHPYTNGPHLVLSCSLTDFDEIVTGSDRIFKIGVAYELYSIPPKKLLKSGNVVKTVPITESNAESIVSAASQATHMMLKELQFKIQK